MRFENVRLGLGSFRCVAVGLLGLVAGCTSEPNKEEQAVGTLSQALNGTLVSDNNLTKKGPTFLADPADETARRADTDLYYDTVTIGAFGGGFTIREALPTLEDFKDHYQFDQFGITTYYYNKGDLGIGREMHCSDLLPDPSKVVACYVTNFAAGSDNTEFTFGQSSNIAFANMDASNDFATVAMVFRREVPTNDKVFFIVYDGNGDLQNFAALDRHGINHANAYAADPNNVPAEFGTPGENFNNHIPSNCMTCHGGQYSSAHVGTGSLFLPFDLDQFEFQDAPERTRDDQLAEFKAMNGLVRDVATLSGTAAGDVIREQLDAWYGDSYVGRVYQQEFDSEAVVSGWSSPGDKEVFQSVVRPYCRNCHMAGVFSFNSAAAFPSAAAITDICNVTMPHALQTSRLFWQSAAPRTLEAYLSTDLTSCNPGSYITLDPQMILVTVN